MSIDEGQTAPRPRRGRPPNRASARPEMHQKQRVGKGVTAIGRDGEILSRTHSGTHDKFHIDEKLVPKDWDYQWNTVAVAGSADAARRHSLEMFNNGWRAVPADRHDGMFLPIGSKGDIIVDGMRLEERPSSLSEEARYQDHKRAYDQLRDRNEGLMGRKANLAGSMPQGFNVADGVNYKGRKTNLSMDTSLDGFAPRPRLDIAGSDE